VPTDAGRKTGGGEEIPGPMYSPSPAWPHGPLREFFRDLFFVVGTNRLRHAGIDLQTSRTMLVVRRINGESWPREAE
jgi:hypothetical protein